jgi:hypothetical protein
MNHLIYLEYFLYHAELEETPALPEEKQMKKETVKQAKATKDATRKAAAKQAKNTVNHGESGCDHKN